MCSDYEERNEVQEEGAGRIYLLLAAFEVNAKWVGRG
jgi:hypothetical protein